ncbi:unnamed protein product [marine sediment metagenome]|uniref:Uncharacterized protein n=1 Tax=marine sediment metagenome TaxID=412755 RepID=X0XFW3_9ZZZZ
MITITHTLKGYSTSDPDDPGEASHYVLEFTDQHRKGWTTIADENVPVRLLVTTLERAFRIAGHDRIDDDMKTDTKRMVELFNVYAESR